MAVSSLIWVSGMAQPDIANVVRAVARQVHNPAERHWRAASKVIMYLNKTEELGQMFAEDGDLKLCVR